MSDLEQYFRTNTGRSIHKWLHYFDIYERHLSRFREKSANILEIGVKQGGSLQMWRHYFGRGAKIIGLDIDPRTKFEEDQIEVFIGDQSDKAVLQAIVDKYGPLDVVIDDGSHVMRHMIKTFSYLFPRMTGEGVFIVEDVFTSYHRAYGGGYRHPSSMMEFAKSLVDELNAYHSKDPHSFSVTPFTKMTNSIHFYDGMVIVERGDHSAPSHTKTGRVMFG